MRGCRDVPCRAGEKGGRVEIGTSGAVERFSCACACNTITVRRWVGSLSGIARLVCIVTEAQAGVKEELTAWHPS